MAGLIAHRRTVSLLSMRTIFHARSMPLLRTLAVIYGSLQTVGLYGSWHRNSWPAEKERCVIRTLPPMARLTECQRKRHRPQDIPVPGEQRMGISGLRLARASLLLVRTICGKILLHHPLSLNASLLMILS